MLNDLSFMQDKEVMDSMIDLGYCRQWSNIKSNVFEMINDSENNATLQMIESRCNTKDIKK